MTLLSKEFLTVKECAGALACHPDTVAALIRRGELNAIHLGRAVRVVSASIQSLVEGSKRNMGGAHVDRA